MGAVKKPRPFVRPSVTLGTSTSEVKRDWRRVPITKIEQGDVVADFGLVMDSSVNVWWDASAAKKRTDVRLTFQSGKAYTFEGEQTVFAFTAATPDA